MPSAYDKFHDQIADMLLTEELRMEDARKHKLKEAMNISLGRITALKDALRVYQELPDDFMNE